MNYFTKTVYNPQSKFGSRVHTWEYRTGFGGSTETNQSYVIYLKNFRKTKLARHTTYHWLTDHRIVNTEKY